MWGNIKYFGIFHSKKMKEEKDKGEEEVEELLQAAQDQILLNLSLNSHIARAPPTPSSIGDHDKNSDDVGIHLDLERRFQALKTKSPATATQQQQQNNDQELRSDLGNDLSARFAALKVKSSSSSSTSTVGLGLTGTGGAAASSALYDEESEDEEEQVQKLIDWAKDAARLDPSPPSDDEEEQELVDHHDEDSSASEQDINHTPRKRK